MWPPGLSRSSVLRERVGTFIRAANRLPTCRHHSKAHLNLQLFELRREPVLREARDWFLREFNPESFDELVALVSGERNASFRMVVGYWDMAASLVTTGAIDAAFLAAHGEVFVTFGKIHRSSQNCARSVARFLQAHRSRGIGRSECRIDTCTSPYGRAGGREGPPIRVAGLIHTFRTGC